MLLPWLDRRTLICCESEFNVEWLMEGSLSTSTEEWWGIDKWNNSSSRYGNDPGDLLLCSASSSVHLLQKSMWDPTGKAFSSLSCESSFGLLLSCEHACFFTTFLCLACDQARTTKWSLCMVKLLFSLLVCFYFWPLLTVYQKRLLGSSFRQHSHWKLFWTIKLVSYSMIASQARWFLLHSKTLFFLFFNGEVDSDLVLHRTCW